MYKMGQTSGASCFVNALIDSGIVKSADDLANRINAFYSSKEED